MPGFKDPGHLIIGLDISSYNQIFIIVQVQGHHPHQLHAFIYPTTLNFAHI